MKRIFKSLLLTLVFSSYSIAGVMAPLTVKRVIPKTSINGFYLDRYQTQIYKVVGAAVASDGESLVVAFEISEDGTCSDAEEDEVLLSLDEFKSEIEIDGEYVSRFVKLGIIDRVMMLITRGFGIEKK